MARPRGGYGAMLAWQVREPTLLDMLTAERRKRMAQLARAEARLAYLNTRRGLLARKIAAGHALLAVLEEEQEQEMAAGRQP